MFVVHMYVEAANTSPKEMLRQTGYILEYERKNGTVHEHTEYMRQAGTYNNAILKTLIKAVEELKKPCEIHLHSQNDYILGAVSRYLPRWAENNYQSAKGTHVRNHFDWAILHEKLKNHITVPEPGMHMRYGEMLDAMENMEKPHKD